MTNYENDILEALKGETPRQKYDFLQEMLNVFRKHNDGVEATLLTICDNMEKRGIEMYRMTGADSYIERCHNHDAQMLIYSITNKSKIDKMNFIKWREEVQSKQ